MWAGKLLILNMDGSKSLIGAVKQKSQREEVTDLCRTVAFVL